MPRRSIPETLGNEKAVTPRAAALGGFYKRMVEYRDLVRPREELPGETKVEQGLEGIIRRTTTENPITPELIQSVEVAQRGVLRMADAVLDLPHDASQQDVVNAQYRALRENMNDA